MVRAHYAYTANDDTLFRTREEAEVHEAKIALRARFPEMESLTIDQIAENIEPLLDIFTGVKKEFVGYEPVGSTERERREKGQSLEEADLVIPEPDTQVVGMSPKPVRGLKVVGR